MGTLTSFATVSLSGNRKEFPTIHCAYDGNKVSFIPRKRNRIQADWAEAHCNHMQIQEGVTTIKDEAFYADRFYELESVSIPKSVTTIGHSAFKGCRLLKSINIPENVKTIGPSAFQNCSRLTSINIPSNVSKIEPLTFLNCWSLTAIKIPESVTVIGEFAFSGCDNLTSISFTNENYEIDIAKSAFNGTQIVFKLDYEELPEDSLKVIELSKCYQQIDTVSLEELQVDKTVFAVPAGDIIYCFTIETVRGMMQSNGSHGFKHPHSREKFNIFKMNNSKKRIIETNRGSRTRVYL